MSLPDCPKKPFHNYHVETVVLERDVDLVVKTVLAGATDWSQVEALFRMYGWDTVKELTQSIDKVGHVCLE